VVDGEIVVLDANGRPSFQALHHWSTAGLSIVYYAFDLLSCISTAAILLRRRSTNDAIGFGASSATRACCYPMRCRARQDRSPRPSASSSSARRRRGEAPAVVLQPGRRSGTTSRLATSVAKSGRPEDLRYRAAV